MTYEELEKQLKAIEKEENAFMRKCSKKEYNLKMKYINEHKQIDIKRFQRISVRLRITEETRKLIGDKHRAMAKNQPSTLNSKALTLLKDGVESIAQNMIYN